MIKAQPTAFHRRFFSAYFRRRAAARFSRILLNDGHDLERWDRRYNPDLPLVIVANHSSWWDAVMPILLSLDHFNHDAYGIMEEAQLRRYGFFRRLGMFSVDRDNPRSARHSLGYAAELLRGTGRVLWLFPQGEIVPNDRRPIHCYSGTSHIIRLIGHCVLLPIAFRYELLHEEYPVALCRAGTAETIGPDEADDIPALTHRIAGLITMEADRLRTDVLDQDLTGYTTILRGKGSIDQRWDRARGIKHPRTSEP